MKKNSAVLTAVAVLMAGPLPGGEDSAFVRPPSPLLSPGTHLLAVPFADLRRNPQPIDDTAALHHPYKADPLQETQILFGEEVRWVREAGEWAYIEAVEQAEYSHKDAWEGYPGWVPKRYLEPKPEGYAPNAIVILRYAKLYSSPDTLGVSAEIPFGAQVKVGEQDDRWAEIELPGGSKGYMQKFDLRFNADLPKSLAALRLAVVDTAKNFLGDPYYWGGLTPHRQDWTTRPSGLDCSGLVHLAYRVNGVAVPRDSHEQFMMSHPLRPTQLEPGDLLFLAKKDDPNRVVHVMLSMGEDRFLESVEAVNAVRYVTAKEKLGRPLKKIPSMEAVGDYFVFAGRLLPDLP